MSENVDMKPDGIIVYVKGAIAEDKAPKICMEHPTHDNRMFKICSSDTVILREDNGSEWFSNEHKDLRAICLLLEDNQEEINMQLGFTCENSCHTEIMPYKVNVYKHFVLVFEFCKREYDDVTGSEKLVKIDTTTRKIAIGKDPLTEAAVGIENRSKWSENFNREFDKSPDALKYVNMNLEIDIKVPKEAKQLEEGRFETIIGDAKKLCQIMANEIISKDIKKMKKQSIFVKNIQDDAMKQIEWFTEMNDQNNKEWKERCKILEDEIVQMKAKLQSLE